MIYIRFTLYRPSGDRVHSGVSSDLPEVFRVVALWLESHPGNRVVLSRQYEV